MKLLNVCNVYSVYDVKVVKLMLLWFIAGILCETCKVSDVFQAYHMKLSYCYNKRSVSLCFQMPLIELHPRAGTV